MNARIFYSTTLIYSIFASTSLLASEAEACKCGYDALPGSSATKNISAQDSVSVKQEAILDSLSSVDLDSISSVQRETITQLVSAFEQAESASEEEKQGFYNTISAKKNATNANVSRRIPATVSIGEIGKRLSSLRSKVKRNYFSQRAVRSKPRSSTVKPFNLDQNNSEIPGGLLDQRLSGFISNDNVISKQSDTSTESGFEGLNQKFVAGADYRINNQTFAGLAIGVVNGRADMDSDGGALVNRAGTLISYGSYNLLPNWYVEGVVSIGSRDFKMHRKINYTLNNSNVRASVCSEPESSYFGLSFGSGYSKTFKNGHTLTGVLGLNQTYITIDTFEENGCNNNSVAYSLVIGEQSITSNILSIGGHWNQAISTGYGVLIPQLSFNWIKELKGDSDTIVAYFQTDPGKTRMNFKSGNKDVSFITAKFSLSIVLPKGMSGFLMFETQQFINNYQQNTISLSIRKEF